MEQKKIVMFYKKEKFFKDDPFEDKGVKKTVYHDFFTKGSVRGFDMFLVMGAKKYLGGLKFKDPLFFNFEKEKFEITTKAIKADAIFDRSGGTDFPLSEISDKVLDHRNFKLICWNKILMYKYLKGFCPPSFVVRKFDELERESRFFKNNEIAVLKPVVGLKGNDVYIDIFSNILQLKNIDFNKEWILQKYINTSGGIKGLVQGEHDLRVVIANGKIVFSHIRQPISGKKVANVSQGGSILEIDIDQIPERVFKKVKILQEKIDKDFDMPLYSIDFGVQNNKPFVFEINDTIGFPSSKMKNAKLFIDEVLESLAIRAER